MIMRDLGLLEENEAVPPNVVEYILLIPVLCIKQIAQDCFEDLKICFHHRRARNICCASIFCYGSGVTSLYLCCSIPNLTICATSSFGSAAFMSFWFGVGLCDLSRNQCDEIKQQNRQALMDQEVNLQPLNAPQQNAQAIDTQTDYNSEIGSQTSELTSDS